MKSLKIVFYTLLFTSFGAFAQYGNNMYNKNYGVNRNIGRTYSSPPTNSPAEIERNKKEQLDKFMEKLKKDLTLDELQMIAIQNEIEKTIGAAISGCHDHDADADHWLCGRHGCFR